MEGAACCDWKVVDLGIATVRIHTNVPSFSGFRFFAEISDAADSMGPFDYELYCIDREYPHYLDETLVRAHGDHSFRGDRFRSGFYLTHHIRPSATLISRGSRHYIIGRRLDRIIWSWYTKYILTIHSLRQGWLHVKAAAFALDGKGVLVIGRGSGGKTVLVTQMCTDGATFVSNTHVIIDFERLGPRGAYHAQGSR